MWTFIIGTTKVDAGRYLADNVGGSAYNSFNQFEPGTYTLTVKESGTDNVIATSDEANLVKGGVYTDIPERQKSWNRYRESSRWCSKKFLIAIDYSSASIIELGRPFKVGSFIFCDDGLHF